MKILSILCWKVTWVHENLESLRDKEDNENKENGNSEHDFSPGSFFLEKKQTTFSEKQSPV